MYILRIFLHTLHIATYYLDLLEVKFICSRIKKKAEAKVLWIHVVSQGVDCFYSVGLGCSWTFTVIFLNDQRGSTLFVSMYISFA